ncbi:MAG: ABC-2 type transport system permease protein [Roseivirga sp.]|jgi:ABC-2 type transport system permease protein
MRQLLLIVRKEIKIALREKLVVALGSIIVLLLGVALYAGYLSYKQQRNIILETQAEKRQEWLNQGDKHPHIAAHYGTFVFKPKTVLSLFDFGLDAFTGTSVYLEAHYQHAFMFRPAQDHSSMIRFGELSAALVLQVLMPLLIIFLAFASFTHERESGTLKLLVSQGVAFHTLTWGKVLAYLIMLSVILLPFILGIGAISMVGVEQAAIPDVATRTVLLAIIYGVYLFLFVAFAVWLSLRSSTGRNALLTLLSFWVLLIVLMPKTVANLSESFYKHPSMREFKAAIDKDKTNGLDGKTPRSVRIANLKKEYLEEYKVDSVQQLPFNFDGVSMQAGEEFGNSIYDHHLGKLRKIFHQQNRLGNIASLVNPFLSVQHLSMVLCGTDTYTFIHFEEEVEHYRRELVRKMNEDMTNNSNYGEFYGYKAGRDLWEQIEDFAYQTPTIWELLQYYWMEVLSLLIWLVVIILLIGYTNHKIKPLHG